MGSLKKVKSGQDAATGDAYTLWLYEGRGVSIPVMRWDDGQGGRTADLLWLPRDWDAAACSLGLPRDWSPFDGVGEECVESVGEACGWPVVLLMDEAAPAFVTYPRSENPVPANSWVPLAIARGYFGEGWDWADEEVARELCDDLDVDDEGKLIPFRNVYGLTPLAEVAEQARDWCGDHADEFDIESASEELLSRAVWVEDEEYGIVYEIEVERGDLYQEIMGRHAR